MKNYREVAKEVLERRDAYAAAQRKRVRTARKAAAWTMAAAGVGGICLALLVGNGIGLMEPAGESASSPGQTAYNGSHSTASDTADSPEIPGGSAASGRPDHDSAQVSSDDPKTSQGNVTPNVPDGGDTGAYPADPGSGLLPVSYSSLPLAQGQVKPEVLLQYGGSSSEADILPFSEEMLSKSCAILEGELTDMYLKHYTYDTYDDKFGTTEVYHNQASSIVYELRVDKVWYGDSALCGTSVLIEDETYLMDSYFSLKVGCSYVIPLRDAGEQKAIWKDYAGGDLTRDSRYATLYPHHPQIEVTLDGDYIVTDDWETLCSGKVQDIDLEVPTDGTQSPYQDTLIEYHPENQAGEDGLITTEWRTLLISRYDARYYYDRLKLVEADEFFIQLNGLIQGLP